MSAQEELINDAVYNRARDIAESMCLAYRLGLEGKAVEFVPRQEHDRDAWVMGNEKREELFEADCKQYVAKYRNLSKEKAKND